MPSTPAEKSRNGFLPKSIRIPHIPISTHIHFENPQQNMPCPGEFLVLSEVKERCPYFAIIYGACCLVTKSYPTLL